MSIEPEEGREPAWLTVPSDCYVAPSAPDVAAPLLGAGDRVAERLFTDAP